MRRTTTLRLALAAAAFFARDAAYAATQTVTVAMCQVFCLDGDREGNFVRLENALREAAAAGAEIACFPECCLLGWVNPDAHTRAHPIPGKDSDRLGRLARQYGLFVCAGLAEKDGTNLYDAAVLIDDTGKLLLTHRKMHILTELMTPPYTPGTNLQVAETRLGRIGVMICADTFLNEHLKGMDALKPHLVLVPYGWVAEERNWPKHGDALANVVLNAGRVAGAPVVGTDSVGEVAHGPWTGFLYGGHSVAYDGYGHLLGRAADRERDVKIVRVPLPYRSPPGDISPRIDL